MWASLRARLVLTHLLIVGLVLAVVGVSFFAFLVGRPLASSLVYRRLDTIATAVDVRQAVAPQLAPQTFARAISLLGRRMDARGLILNPDGEVVLDSAPDKPLPESSQLAALASPTGDTQGALADATGQTWLYVARRLNSDRTLVVASPRPTLRTLAVALAVDGVAGPLLGAAGIGLVLSLALAWLLSRWVTGPLRRLSEGARRVASGDFNLQLPPTGPSEVKAVSAAFNEMVREVRAGQQAQRDFVANVSHELKTPLSSIQGFAQAILDGTAGSESERQHAAGVIFEESQRLRRLVDRLLDLARLEGGQVEFRREPVQLDRLLSGVVEQFSVAGAEKNVSLDVHAAGLPLIHGDVDRLAQVFINLVDNALQHAPPGSQVRIAAVPKGDHVVVSVTDEGPGIPSEELNRVFERFYQVDRARSGGEARGVGLGLAISREIVLAHRGSIRVESQPGQGAAFAVDLPISRPDDTTWARRR